MTVTVNFDIPGDGTDRDKNLFTSLELFAGAGGMALGTHRAGFRHVGLIEWDKFAVDTLRENSHQMLGLSPEYVMHNDAREIDYSQLLGKIDLLSGGPPCQPFSGGGSQGGPDDPQNMFPIALDAVGQILPKAVLFENVIGLCRRKFALYVDYIERRLRFPLHRSLDGECWEDHRLRMTKICETDFSPAERYFVTYQKFDTADFGVPQKRERVLFIAFRCDLGIEKFSIEPTHSKEALLRDQWVTGNYWHRHGVEPFNYQRINGKKYVKAIRENQLPLDDRCPWITVRDVLSDLPPAVLRGQPEQITNHVQHPGARAYKGHTGSFFDYPSKALKAGNHGTPGGENMLRVPPENKVRYFTTREAARLQTFPDEWRFHGTWGACIKQLGNAVPVEVIRLFATRILELLRDNSRMVEEGTNGNPGANQAS